MTILRHPEGAVLKYLMMQHPRHVTDWEIKAATRFPEGVVDDALASLMKKGCVKMTTRLRANAHHYKYTQIDDFLAKSKYQVENDVRIIEELKKLQKGHLSRTRHS